MHASTSYCLISSNNVGHLITKTISTLQPPRHTSPHFTQLHFSTLMGKGLACNFLVDGMLLNWSVLFLSERERAARRHNSTYYVLKQVWPLWLSNFYICIEIHNVLKCIENCTAVSCVALFNCEIGLDKSYIGFVLRRMQTVPSKIVMSLRQEHKVGQL
jgi:hypothetical protein